MLMRRRTLLGLAVSIAAAFSAPVASAADFPDRTITMVVPFSAGGSTDLVARLVANKMSEKLGQQIVVENVGGAGGSIGAAQVARAEPDGYTILMCLAAALVLYVLTDVMTFAYFYPRNEIM